MRGWTRLLPLVVTALLYLRGTHGPARASSAQAGCFWAGWSVLALSLVSPVHSLGGVLFSAHMVQHELLMLVAAPLLVLSRPLAPFVRGLPFAWRRAAGRWSKTNWVRPMWRRLTEPLTAWLLHAAALWIWHAPALFQATVDSETVHAAQHLSFLLTALLFWWSLIYAQGRAGYGAGVVYIFTTAVHTSILGALLTFSPVVWYPIYRETTRVWGLTPLQDQQIGGLVMWIPAGVLYLAAGLALFAAWLRQSEVISARSRYAE